LRISDDGIKFRRLDGLQDAFGFGEVGRQRLLDQHRNAALDGGHDRIDVKVLVRAYDGGGDLRALEQFNVALGDKVRTDLWTHFAGPIRVLFGEPDPLDRGVASRHLAAEQADAAAANDCEANALGRCLHWFTPARIFCLNSAIAEIVSLDSGRSTGSFRSAERSAAL
jgi:hypothetical protein